MNVEETLKHLGNHRDLYSLAGEAWANTHKRISEDGD